MGSDAPGADVVAAQGPCGPPSRKKKQVDRPCDARPSTKKNRWTASAFMLTRAPIAEKKKTLKTISTTSQFGGGEIGGRSESFYGSSTRVVDFCSSLLGLARTSDGTRCNKCGNGSLAAPRPPPSAENLQMLHNANALDIALYAYAAERFDAHFGACFRGR